jgi:2-phosphosulfolactate phosphatase
MAYFDQQGYRVRCEWGASGVERLAGDVEVTIIVDVLSFSTSTDIAVGRGGVVLPYRWQDGSAASYAALHKAQLAGPRSRTDGGYSLSPASLIDMEPGTRLVLPSPNGSTLSFSASSHGCQVVAGCLRNCHAVAHWASSAGRSSAGSPVAVIPAGERWSDGSLRPSFEDLVGAGAIIRRLPQPWSPEAQVAVAAFERVAAHLEQEMVRCSSGRQLIEGGYEQDVGLASQLAVSTTVPVMHDNAFAGVSP